MVGPNNLTNMDIGGATNSVPQVDPSLSFSIWPMGDVNVMGRIKTAIMEFYRGE